jgi:flagellar biogenesis protein FliO
VSPVWDYLRASALGLCAFIGLGAALLYASRRAGVARAPGALEVLARLPLEARRAVYVVRVLDQVLILGASEAGIEKLGELPESAAAELRKSAPPRSPFAQFWAVNELRAGGGGPGSDRRGGAA